MQKIIYCSVILLAHLVIAQPQDYFAHIQAANGIDLFTHRKNQSGLTCIYNLLVALKNHKLTLEQVQYQLPRGVHLRVDDKKALILSKFKTDQNNLVDYTIEPTSINAHLVLFVQNDFILSEFIEALIHHHTIYEFLAANNLFRLVLQSEKGRVRDHLVLAKGKLKLAPPQIEQEGLIRLLDTDHMVFYDKGDFVISEFLPDSDSVSIFHEILSDFWYGLNQSSSNYFVSTLHSIFISIGYQNVDQMLPLRLIQMNGMSYYTAMLAAMGFRFDPAAHASGFYSLIETEEERKSYRNLVFRMFVNEKHLYTDALDHQMLKFYERAAAAFKLLREPIPLRYKKSDVLKPSDRDTIQNFDDATDQFPFKRLLFMMDVIQHAEKIDSKGLEAKIMEGRQRNWNFMPKDSCAVNLKASDSRI